MPIDSFIRPGPGAFDADVVAAMSEAFDVACNEIQNADELVVKREVIARRIIDAARRGERDPVRLLEAALRRPD
jgi:crotonobetainyl-CoA:carnitine CoA-transferase CaiB-like acyl-CoA transferase